MSNNNKQNWDLIIKPKTGWFDLNIKELENYLSENKIFSKPDIIIGVHYFGITNKMKNLINYANTTSTWFVEDATHVIDFQKKGTGIWDIDLISASSVEELEVDNIRKALRTDELGSLHIKDPFAFNLNDFKNLTIMINHTF